MNVGKGQTPLQESQIGVGARICKHMFVEIVHACGDPAAVDAGK